MQQNRCQRQIVSNISEYSSMTPINLRQYFPKNMTLRPSPIIKLNRLLH